jgi:ATP-dependent protease ClpP protease subunit
MPSSKSLCVIWLVTNFALFSSSGLSMAADIAATPVDNDPSAAVITVQGEINEGDGDVFSNVLQGYQRGVVVFSSPGGNLFAGLQIGQIIRTRQLVTAVSSGTYCASACALAWLGGVHRFMQASGLVGFHAAYNVDPDGSKTESGVGNALVGAYLDRLGLSDQAIIYIEQADPDSVTWLTPQDAQAVGIDVNVVPNNPPSSTASSSSPSSSALAPTQTAAQAFAPPSFGPLVHVEESAATQVLTMVIPRAFDQPLLPDSQGTSQRAIAFAQDYIAHWSEANDQALGYFNSIYAPSVVFYGTSIDRTELMKQKLAYAERWPLRIYTLKPGTAVAPCQDDSSTCTVSGVAEWDCRCPARKAHSIGTANFSLTVSFASGVPQVTGESGSVISRETLPQ